MFSSLNKKLLPLSDKLAVYSGHDYGSVPYRSLGEEKQLNPFLNCSDIEAFRKLLREQD